MAYRKRDDGRYVDENGNVISEQEYQQLGFGANGIPTTDSFNETPGAQVPEEPFSLDLDGLVDDGAPVTGPAPDQPPSAPPPNNDTFGAPPPPGKDPFAAMTDGFNALVADADTPGTKTGDDYNTEMDSRGVTSSGSKTDTDSGAITITDEDIKTTGEEESEVTKTGLESTDLETEETTDLEKKSEFGNETDIDTKELTVDESETEFETEGLSEFDKSLLSAFESKEMFQNWNNTVAQNWTQEQKQQWLQRQQQGWTEEERRNFEDSVKQTNAKRDINVKGEKEGVVETNVDDEYGFGSFLRELAERDSDELGRKNDRLSALSSGGDIRGQVAAAVREAVSGPAAQGAGSSARARVGSRAAAEVGDKIFNDRVAAASAMEAGGSLGVGAANAARQFAGETEKSTEDYSEDTEDNQTVDETGSVVGGEDTKGSETVVVDESSTELGTGSGTEVVDESGTTVGTKEGTEVTDESGTEVTNTSGKETTLAEGLRDVSTNQSVTGFEEVDQTINSIASSFSETLSDEQINSMASTIQEMTKDATNATEAWERLSGMSLGAMFGETFGVQPESGGGGMSYYFCRHYHTKTKFTDEMFNCDIIFGNSLPAAINKNYRKWAEPFVSHLSSSKFLSNLYYPSVRGWVYFACSQVMPYKYGFLNNRFRTLCFNIINKLLPWLEKKNFSDSTNKRLFMLLFLIPSLIERLYAKDVVLNNLTSQKGAI